MASTTPEAYKKAEPVASEFKNKVMDKSTMLEGEFEKIAKPLVRKSTDFISSLSMDSAADFVKDYTKSSRDYVRQNPIKGLAIAAGAGVVVGGLWAFFSRRKH